VRDSTVENHMKNVVVGGGALVLGVLGLVGCGAADSQGGEENVAAVEQALDNQQFVQPAGYPNVGVSYDAVSTLLNSYGDWDKFGIISPRSFLSYGAAGQGAGFYGMNCDLNTFPYRDFLKGISTRGDAYGHTAKCGRNTLNTNFFAHVQGASASREVKYLSKVAVAGSTTNIDDKLGSELSFNWDTTASNKAECRAHYVATAIAQIETGEVDAIVCNKVDDGFIVNVSSSAMCNALPFDSVNNHCVGNNCSGGNDWAVGFVKNTCGTNQYVKGVSKRKLDGKIKTLLCCNFN